MTEKTRKLLEWMGWRTEKQHTHNPLAGPEFKGLSATRELWFQPDGSLYGIDFMPALTLDLLFEYGFPSLVKFYKNGKPEFEGAGEDYGIIMAGSLFGDVIKSALMLKQNPCDALGEALGRAAIPDWEE